MCETDPMAFETSYQIVLESASKEFLTPQQIFTIARYMEHRGYTQRAYRLAVIALQYVHIGYNQVNYYSFRFYSNYHNNSKVTIP